MKILLTGATGFLGSHVAEQLSQQGHRVRCLVRKTADTHFLQNLNNIEFYEGHLEDINTLAQVTTGVDAIIHAAGLVKAKTFDEFYAVNAGGTLKLLTAAKQYAPQLKRFILVSSLAATGPSFDGQPLIETKLTTFNPVTHYGRSKLEAERHALTFVDSLPITIIRPPLIYGPRDKECLALFRLIPYKIFPFFGSKKNTTSAIYCVDAASAINCAIEAKVKSGNAYFIEDGQQYQVEYLIKHLAAAMNQTLWFTPELPLALFKPFAIASEYYGKLFDKAVMLTRDKLQELMQPHWVCSSEKARHELHWQPTTDWATGVKLTYDWYKQAGWL